MYWLMFQNPKNNFQDVIIEMNKLKGGLVTEYSLIKLLKEKFELKVELDDKMKKVGWTNFDYSLEHGLEMTSLVEVVRVCVPECPKEIDYKDNSLTIESLNRRVKLIEEKIDMLDKILALL